MYIYGDNNEIKNLSQKYQRYTDDIEIIENENGSIMKINNKNTKNNFFKDTLFKIKDFGSDTIEFITDLLIN